jgi:hypothetical protein
MHLKQTNEYDVRQLNYSYTDRIPVTKHNPHNSHIKLVAAIMSQTVGQKDGRVLHIMRF